MTCGKLTKAELSKEIADSCDSSLKDSRQVLDVVLSAMTDALARGERIEIRGFGAFATRVRKTRISRNPITGGKLEVPAKRVPYFRASKDLQEILNVKSLGVPGAQ
jgi:integration host factor subunit beta